MFTEAELFVFVPIIFWKKWRNSSRKSERIFLFPILLVSSFHCRRHLWHSRKGRKGGRWDTRWGLQNVGWRQAWHYHNRRRTRRTFNFFPVVNFFLHLRLNFRSFRHGLAKSIFSSLHPKLQLNHPLLQLRQIISLVSGDRNFLGQNSL